MSVIFSHVSKSYGGNAVFTDFSHTFREGGITCVMGPSGCGKTTLLNLLLGLEKPDSGAVTGVEGKKFSAVFQEDRLCENITAVSNIRLVEPSLTRGRAAEALSALGLGDSLDRPVKEFSGGMKRRTAILRALLARYDILAADEPFKGLDAEQKLITMKYFKDSTAGKTVILVTHDESEAEFMGGGLLKL